jgi:membrane associated rhomboid family serine protease
MLPISDTIPRRSPPLAVWLLILTNSLIFLFELMMPEPALERFFHLFGLVPARYTHPDWAVWAGFPVDDYWPYLTSMFLHGGWMHIIGNMWTLWIFGDNVEDRMGSVRFVIFYLLCGLAAGAVHWFTNPNSTVPTVGASGAIAGVMGA